MMATKAVHGASADADRAVGLRPEPVPVSAVPASVPCARNVYQRLNAARVDFHAMELRKSGKFPKGRGNYFELADFIVPALRLFDKHGLAGLVSFAGGEARLDVVNTDDPGQSVRFSSPMGTAALAGCHEVQNIGAVQTYQRRYLWMLALEVVEHDALDSGDYPVDAANDRNGDGMPDAEWAKLTGMIAATSSNVPALLKFLGISLPDNNLRLLNQAEYGKVIGALNDKLAKLAKADTNKEAANVH